MTYLELINMPEKFEERQAYFDKVLDYVENKCKHRQKWIRVNVSSPFRYVSGTIKKNNFIESICFILGNKKITIKNVNKAIDDFIVLSGREAL